MPKPLFISGNGTGVADPFGPGFSTDIGRALNNPWNDIYAQFMGAQFANKVGWQPIGYPAAVFPMKPSVEAGRAEVNRQIALHERDGSCPVGWPLFLSGYSQFAIVMGEVWALDILSPSGIHHNRLDDVRVRGGIINFGDPIRCPGVAHGNEVAGFPVPKKLDGQVTGGIGGPTCLTLDQTPDTLLSCALDGDLYAAAPVGTDPWKNEPEVGVIETRIYDFIMRGSFGAFLGFAKDLADEIGQPFSTTWAICQAIFNGMKFAAAGPQAPHWQYGPFVPAMVDWVLQRA